MRVSEKGLGLLKDREKLYLAAYQDTGGVWTIGWGHTQGVRRGDTCTIDEAQGWLEEDVRVAEGTIERLVTRKLTQSQFDAMVVFAFNIGEPEFRDSELLKFLNQGKYFLIPQQLCRWYYDNKVPLRGLMLRRLAEATLFMSEAFEEEHHA